MLAADPSTSAYGLICKQGLYRGDQIKAKSSGKYGYRRRGTLREDTGRRHCATGLGPLQAKKRQSGPEGGRGPEGPSLEPWAQPGPAHTPTPGFWSPGCEDMKLLQCEALGLWHFIMAAQEPSMRLLWLLTAACPGSRPLHGPTPQARPRDCASPERPHRTTRSACSLCQERPPCSIWLTPLIRQAQLTLLSSGRPLTTPPGRGPPAGPSRHSSELSVLPQAFPWSQDQEGSYQGGLVTTVLQQDTGTLDMLSKPNKPQENETVTLRNPDF